MRGKTNGLYKQTKFITEFYSEEDVGVHDGSSTMADDWAPPSEDEDLDKDNDIYMEAGIAEDLDNDEISPAEAAFMRGMITDWKE